MSAYPPPTKTSSIFNPTFFISSDSSTVTTDYLSTYYLKKAGGQTVLAQETFTGGIKTDSISSNTSGNISVSGNIKANTIHATTSGGWVTIGDSLQDQTVNLGDQIFANTYEGKNYLAAWTAVNKSTTPTAPLDVSGSAKVSGSLILSNPITPYTSTGITPTSTELGYQGVANLASNLTLTSATNVTVVSWNISPGVWLLEGHATVRFSTGSTNAVTAFNHYISTDSSNSYMTKYEGPSTFSTSTSSKTVTYIMVVTNSSLSSMPCSWVMNVTWTGTNFYAVGGDTRSTAVRYTRIA